MFSLPPARNSMIVEVYAVLGCTVRRSGAKSLGQTLILNLAYAPPSVRLLHCGIFDPAYVADGVRPGHSADGSSTDSVAAPSQSSSGRRNRRVHPTVGP